MHTGEDARFLSSCDYKVPFLCRVICIRRKPVIGRAVMARREGEIRALVQFQERLQLNVKSEDLQTPESEIKKGSGSRKKGRWRKLSACISYVTKAMVSQSSFFYYSKTFHP